MRTSWILFITLVTMTPQGELYKTIEMTTDTEAECVSLGELMYARTHAQAYQCKEIRDGSQARTRNRRS